MVSRSHLFTHFVAFLTVAVWGSTFVFTKMLLQAGLTPAQIFTFRFIIAYVLLLAFSMSRQHKWFCNSWKDETLMVALGITGGSVYFLTENAAMLFTTATNTSLLLAAPPQDVRINAANNVSVVNNFFILFSFLKVFHYPFVI